MKNQRWIFWFLFLLLLVACQSEENGNDSANSTDDDDDNDDESPATDDDDDATPELPRLDLVIVDPIFWLEKSAAEMADELDAMKTQKVGGLIWRWTYRAGKTTYPSAVYTPFLSMAESDPLETVIALAEARGLTVYLGLSAGQEIRDYYLDPIGPEFIRNQTVLEELVARYSAHKNLAGFYLPFEFVAEPTEDEQTLLSLIAAAIHEKQLGYRVLMTIRYPGFPQYRVTQAVWLNHGDPGIFLDAIDDSEYRARWGKQVLQSLEAAKIDTALVSTRMGSRLNDFAGAREDYQTLLTARENINGTTALWLQLDLYDALGNRDTPIRTALGPLDAQTIATQVTMPSEGTVGFGWDYWRNTDGTLNATSTVAEPELLAKAEATREHLIGKTLHDGQLATVINGQFPLGLYDNVWQEDACWLTGLYLAAESYRYAATGDPDSRAAAKAAWRAAYRMADVTPKRGEVVRNWSRYLYDQTNPLQPGDDTLKRWHKHPTKEIYWVGDISVDQLSGYFYGLAAYYDLAADETDRAQIREITDVILGDILDHDLHAVQFDGKRTTYGNLRAAPELAGSFMQIAYHITGKERYRDQFNQLTGDEYMDIRAILYHWAMHFVAHKYDGQHFQDSGYAPFFEYLDDPEAYHRWVWALEYVYQGSFHFGNVYANFTHQMHVPDAAGEAMAISELYRWDPELLENGNWFRKVNEKWDENAWVDLDRRPAKEFMWLWAPWGATEPRGGPNHRYTGVDFLLVYWQGRYKGWIR